MAQQTSAMRANITRFTPEPEAHHNKPDTLPSDMQPKGVDEEYSSLEEALMS